MHRQQLPRWANAPDRIAGALQMNTQPNLTTSAPAPCTCQRFLPVAALALSHHHNGGHYHSPAHLSSDIGASAVTIDRLVVLPGFQGRGTKEWLIDACCARLGDAVACVYDKKCKSRRLVLKAVCVCGCAALHNLQPAQSRKGGRLLLLWRCLFCAPARARLDIACKCRRIFGVVACSYSCAVAFCSQAARLTKFHGFTD